MVAAANNTTSAAMGTSMPGLLDVYMQELFELSLAELDDDSDTSDSSADQQQQQQPNDPQQQPDKTEQETIPPESPRSITVTVCFDNARSMTEATRARLRHTRRGRRNHDYSNGSDKPSLPDRWASAPPVKEGPTKESSSSSYLHQDDNFALTTAAIMSMTKSAGSTCDVSSSDVSSAASDLERATQVHPTIGQLLQSPSELLALESRRKRFARAASCGPALVCPQRRPSGDIADSIQQFMDHELLSAADLLLVSDDDESLSDADDDEESLEELRIVSNKADEADEEEKKEDVEEHEESKEDM